MPTLGLQEEQWSEDTPSVEWTGGHRSPGLTMRKIRMWRGEEEERGLVEGVWRGREWEGAGRGGSKHEKQEGAGRTAGPDL